MKAGITPRSIAISFVIILGLYFLVFYGIEQWRHRRGGWEVNFVADADGNPSLVIYQPRLNISSAEIILTGEHVALTNFSEKVVFDRPGKPVPFGKVIYEDLTVLPGVVTFDLFGHELELLPRTLIVNKQAVRWASDTTVELSMTNKPAQAPRPARQNE